MTEPEHLRDLLEFYRDGRLGLPDGGLPFAAAWGQAVERVCGRSEEGRWWRGVFEEQRGVWERAYNREPPEHGDAATLRDPERTEPVPDEELRDEPERVCMVCGGSMEGRAPQARTCGEDCSRVAALKLKARHKHSNVTPRPGELGESTAPSSRQRVAA